MLRIKIAILLVLVITTSFARDTKPFADSLRKKYAVPELSYAVVSSDSVYEMAALGVRKVHTRMNATLSDRFRIGSNTKAITAYMAALLVKQGKLNWDTRFFDLFPEMKKGSNVEYHQLTLPDLLTMRTKLLSYTYTNLVPTKAQFKGNEEQQRYQFARWFFKQVPYKGPDTIHFSNLGYIAAGLMLEKVTGKPYKQMVKELGAELGIDFDFGQPNLRDATQTWGHNAMLVPEAPTDNYKLNWLLPAGNINATLPGYIKFIQLQLKGLHNGAGPLSTDDFNFLHFGLPRFSLGWFWEQDEKGRLYSYNVGNPGTFLTKVCVFKAEGKAFIIFSNAQTDEAEEGIDVLLQELKRKYL